MHVDKSMLVNHQYTTRQLLTRLPETAAHECVSEDALVHLKTYKYQSVDKSFLSHYVLRHYVGVAELISTRILMEAIVECCGTASPSMAGAQYGDIDRIFIRPGQCWSLGSLCAGSCWTSMLALQRNWRCS